MILRIAALALLLSATCLRAQEGLRLKASLAGRRPHPTANAATLPRKGHFVIQFLSFPGEEERQELARRGVRILEYVPDNGLMVAVSRETALDGLGVSWAGALDAADKISPLLAGTSDTVFLAIF